MSTAKMSLTEVAVQNPMFRQAAKDSLFEAVKGEEDLETAETFNQKGMDGSNKVTDGSVMKVTPEELKAIKKMAMYMKYGMMIIAANLMAVAWYNFLSAYNGDFSTTFLAAYLFVFAVLICCFECALRQAALFIVQNFGFMYSLVGRSLFLIFVAILSFQISTYGKVCFAFLLVYMIVSVYVYNKHPLFGKYLKTLHYFNRAKATQKQAFVV